MRYLSLIAVFAAFATAALAGYIDNDHLVWGTLESADQIIWGELTCAATTSS